MSKNNGFVFISKLFFFFFLGVFSLKDFSATVFSYQRGAVTKHSALINWIIKKSEFFLFFGCWLKKLKNKTQENSLRKSQVREPVIYFFVIMVFCLLTLRIINHHTLTYSVLKHFEWINYFFAVNSHQTVKSLH